MFETLKLDFPGELAILTLNRPEKRNAISPQMLSELQSAFDIIEKSPARVGILTGIGFLGAGVILRDPKGHVTGLTTAATIWMCAVLGIVCGLGYWGILAITIGLTVLALLFGRPVERLAERLLKRHESAPTDPSV